MKVLVCGSRDIDDQDVVTKAIYGSPFDPSTIVHGGARGVDMEADKYARDYGIDTEVHPIPEWVWEKIGDKAGPMRNGHMVEQAEAVIAVWDGESSGTKDAMQQAESEGLPVYKVVCDRRDGEWEIVSEVLIEDDQTGLDEFC